MTRLLGGWHATFHTSITPEFHDEASNCRTSLFFICRSLGYSRFTFVKNTISNKTNAERAKFLASNGLFHFISICKSGSFKNTFVRITSLSDFFFGFRRFILLAQTKKVISMNYGSSTSCWKPWRWLRLDLILTMCNIYINSIMNPLI